MDTVSIAEFLYTNADLLNQEQFDSWLEQCSNDFSYRITTFSEELGRPMDWMDKDKSGLAHYLQNANNHERYTGRLRRHLAMPRVTKQADSSFEVRTAVAIYVIEMNGETALYGIGSYVDNVMSESSGLRLTSRVVTLDTRRLQFGPHVPI
uniref:2-aminobenzenesulfonate 2,3-dioxygenase subunit beta n=1 Tax=Alcaligenes sp. TaxID=512 RepID=ABSAB_ALCSP|nr:RecName: Full=2-aminobenzenesulfonate 2,3-dioxygenase subunit beta; AltName: Full=2-aminobenzenesulfonate dioxygenase small subunit; AltName: Full=AbsAb [Alcaligenes sp.]AAF14228.2 AbsAb [Alcaligenes sp. O-1]